MVVISIIDDSVSRRNPHYTFYRVNGERKRYEKIKHSGETEASYARERMLADPNARGCEYDIYQCAKCSYWHVGRRSLKPHLDERRLQHALWRSLRSYMLHKAKQEGYRIVAVNPK